MHWEKHGAWTGEISAAMLYEAGCRYVELAHSERLQHFGETYERVRNKIDAALTAGLTPILCLGETAAEKAAGRSDAVLAWQLATALAGQPDERVADVILAYEPRWAIGSAMAASPDYVAARHATLRAVLNDARSKHVARHARIIYGGSVTPANAADLIAIDDVDGLFVGRAAWEPQGFAKIVAIVSEAARRRAHAAAH
jgi:triosephosphate isomerase